MRSNGAGSRPESVALINKLLNEGQLTRCLAEVEQALAVWPADLRLHAVLNHLGVRLNQPDTTLRASHVLAAAGRISPVQLRRWMVSASQLDRPAEGRLALRQLLSSTSTMPSPVVDFYEFAHEFNDARSIREIRSRVDASPTIYELNAIDVRLDGDSAGALDILDAAIESEPGDGSLRIARARLRVNEGLAEAAMGDAAKALALDNTSRQASRLLVQASFKAASPETVAELLENTLGTPMASITDYVAAIDFAHFALNDLSLAVERAQQGVAAYPHSERLKSTHAVALARLGRHSEAREIADALVSEAEDVAEAHLVHGEISRLRGETSAQAKSLNAMLAHTGLSPLVTSDDGGSIAPRYLSSAKPVVPTTDPRLVSVVMTAFRFDELLPIAIDSILNQSHTNLELIVVDDCSPDHTFDFLQERAAADPRLRPFRMPTNQGTYSAKNLGLRQIRGDMVAFMDSDDFSHPQRFERQLNALDANEDAMLVSHKLFRVTEESQIEFKVGLGLRMAMISPMVRREAIETVGYFDAVRVAADSEFVKRLEAVFGRSAHVHLDDPLLVVTAQQSSLTGGGPFAITWRGLTGPRALYQAAYRNWHHKIRRGEAIGFLDYLASTRPFEAPPSMLR